MRGEIKQLQKRLGTTSIYVTHDQLEAMTLADRLVVLNGGRIEQIGGAAGSLSPSGLDLCRELHRLPGHESPQGEREQRRDLGCDGRQTFGPICRTARSRSACVRKTCASRKPAPACRSWSPSSRTWVPSALLHGHCGGQSIVVAVSPDLPLPDELRLTIAPDRLHFFTADTGKRIEAASV